MEKCKAANGVEYYRSPLLRDVRHGFSTRLGGVSTLRHTASMNLAFGRGDSEDVVMRNLELFGEALEIDPRTAVSLPQIHSDDVIYVTEDMRGFGYYTETSLKCDGYVTDTRDIALGVKTADCVPILLADKAAGVICAIHAGWRGTAAGICARSVEKMLSLGAKKENIYAAIGPSICKCCFEIGEDVAEQLRKIAPMSGLIIPSMSDKTKYFADLPGINREILRHAGIKPENIDFSGLCTCCNDDVFHSHRKTGGVRGTMLALISL